MGPLIFAQTRLDPGKIAANARSFFEAEVEVLEELSADRERPGVRLSLTSRKHGYRGTFCVVAREASPDDYFEAEMAEARGQATNMALLARKCGYVWEITPEGDPPETALLNLCGVLASVALGPVMPADRSTLYGVRGSMERLERLLTR